MESEKQHQRSDVEFLEDLVDELFYAAETELTRRRLATLTQCRTRKNAGI